MLSDGKFKTSNNKNTLIIKSKNIMEKETQIPTLGKTAVNSSDFRIVEFQDHFRIQKRSIIKEWTYFLWIKIAYKDKEIWNTILSNKTILNIHTCKERDKYEYKTKEKCLKWIENYEKYPIYHYC